jgi:prevent-host-death family protein
MAVFTIHRAKNQLSKLIARACAGEEIVIARGSLPIVRLAPIAAGKRRFGALKGKFTVGPEFLESLPDDEVAAWER